MISRYADVLRSFNPGFSAARSRDMAEHVLLLSSYYSLDARLLVAIVGAESSWNPLAVSPVGAQGLGQLMPGTADGLGVLSFEAYENLDGTARYLRRLIRKYSGLRQETRYSLALAGYNAGPAAVARYGGIPPYSETREYVVRVMGLWHKLTATLPPAGGNLVLPGSEIVKRMVSAPRGSVADFIRLDGLSIKNIYKVAVAHVAEPPAGRRTVEPVLAAAPFVILAVAVAPPAGESLAIRERAVLPRREPSVVAHHSRTVAARGLGVEQPARIVSIGLLVPQVVRGNEQIPVTLHVRGTGRIKLIAKIGPTVVDQRSIASTTKQIFLRRLPPSGRSRVVTVRAMAAGASSREAMVVSLPPG